MNLEATNKGQLSGEPHYPASSWWTEPSERGAWYRRAQDEAPRMRESKIRLQLREWVREFA